MKFLLYAAEHPFSDAALSFAAKIAEPTQADISLLYVVEHEGSFEAGRQVLAHAESRLPKKPLESKLKVDRSVDALLEEIETGKHDLLIVGAGQRRRVFRRKPGSVSQRAVNCSPIPVVVVRESSTKLEHLLICTSGSDVSNKVIEIGAKFAAGSGAKATLLYVGGTVPSMYTGFDEMDEHLAKLLATDTPISHHLHRGAEVLSEHNVEGQLRLRYGMVSEEILDEAQRGEYDLIVLGTSKVKSSLKGLLLSNVTRQIIDRAESAVLVAK